MSAADPNRAILTRVADALGELCDALVFVGGCATGLLVTAVRAQTLRMTEDVDLVTQVASLQEYHAMEALFRKRGFVHDLSPDAPQCRWRCQSIAVDLMPSEPGILSFHNRWYPLAVETAQPERLESGLTIRLITAPVFIATKLEAFKGRGNGDFLLSHDLEDIITVIDGRAELMDEIKYVPEDLRGYLTTELQTLLETPDFLDALAGHLPGDAMSQRRLPGLIEKLKRLTCPTL